MNDLIGEYQNTQVPPSIYEKNKSNNKEKIKFFEFLMYSTKSEIAISDLQNTLYWIGITECFVFLLGISLLISYAKQFWSFIFFIFHVLRAVVGFYWLITLPKTQKVIEDLSNYESLSIEEINQQIIKSYKGLVSASETKLRKIIIIYWGLTFLDMLIDLIIFFVLLADWGDIDYGAKNLISLVIIFILFICNFSLVQWFFRLNNQFPDNIQRIIKSAIWGEVRNLKTVIGNLRNLREGSVEVQEGRGSHV